MHNRSAGLLSRCPLTANAHTFCSGEISAEMAGGEAAAFVRSVHSAPAKAKLRVSETLTMYPFPPSIEKPSLGAFGVHATKRYVVTSSVMMVVVVE